jgi:hypothetical protein
MSQFRPSTKIAAVVLLAGVLPWLISVGSHLVIGDATLVQEALHNGLEMMGVCIAFGVALLLLLRVSRTNASPHLLWVVTALVGMGIVDGAHSLSPFGMAFPWLRHLATLIGGTLFALIWLPLPAVARGRRLLVPTVAALATAVAVWLRAERLPADADLRVLVIAMNALGGLGFLAAA